MTHSPKNPQPTKISHIVMMGDSLSDRGTMYTRKLFGIFPMAKLSGLIGKSPEGRFTNGLTWSDYISARIIDRFIIKRYMKAGKSAVDIADDIETAQISPLEGLPLSKKDKRIQQSRNAADEADNVLAGQYKNKASRDYILNGRYKNDHFPVSHQLSPSAANLTNPTNTSNNNQTSNRAFSSSPLPPISNAIKKNYTLNNNLAVQYKGRDFVRNFDEGGLTAHNYKGVLSSSPARFISRLLLSTLGGMRKKLFDDDKQAGIDARHKKATLVIEWSGANDLITVNREPSNLEADKAVAARIQNIREMVKKGYRHFELFDLPDLSLTPRYSRKPSPERENAHAVSTHFNEKLVQEVEKLNKELNNKNNQADPVTINVFKISELLTTCYNYVSDPDKERCNAQSEQDLSVRQKQLDMYNELDRIKFDKKNLQAPFTESNEFKNEKAAMATNHEAPAEGYMFWDDVHPTADMHALLGEMFSRHCETTYNFTAPQKLQEDAKKKDFDLLTTEDLVDTFKEKYNALLHKEQHQFGFFSKLFMKSHIKTGKDDKLTIEGILKHALSEKGDRTRHVITYDLGWIDTKGRVTNAFKDTLVGKAMESYQAKLPGAITIPSINQ